MPLTRADQELYDMIKEVASLRSTARRTKIRQRELHDILKRTFPPGERKIFIYSDLNVAITAHWNGEEISTEMWDI